jgi:hypothetical protein
VSEVTQTILYDPERNAAGIYGNCMQAAVASLLDLEMDAVPHFAQFLWFPAAIELWARGRGLTRRVVQTDVIPQERCIVGGLSPRGVSHVCVAEGGRIIWDPHPSRAGLDTIVDAWFFDVWAHDDLGCWACGAERQS